jgi:Ca2+-transporting ATPase
MKSAIPGSGTVKWHALTPEAVVSRLSSSLDGLTSREAERRLADKGRNEIGAGRRINPFVIAIRQFNGLIIWILIGAGIISGFMGGWLDSIAIFGIVILNAVIGFYQEYKADRSIDSLKRMTAPRARVRRDGKAASVPAAEVVVGDVIDLEAGDLVPADARIVESYSLRCVESALTGESESVVKHMEMLADVDAVLGDRENMVFMGTSVVAGAGKAVVVGIGLETELGRIAESTVEAGLNEGTPLQKRLDSFGRILVWSSLGIVVLLFALGLARGTEIQELTMTSISLAVAAVPEGLPAIVTVALALGVMRMSRRRALVRRLAAVETLGSTTVICTDKTGTLTMGEMTVRALYVGGRSYEVSGDGYGPGGEVRFEGRKADGVHAVPLLEFAAVVLGGNHASIAQEDGVWRVHGDPTEGALLAVGLKAGGKQDRIDHDLPRYHDIPFDSDRKRSSVIRRMADGGLRAFVNGAPELLLDRCSRIYVDSGIRPMSDEDRRSIASANASMATSALRVLGSAFRDMGNAAPGELTADHVEKDLVFVGLAGMHDPPRPEAMDAVAKCRDAGIRVVMITGDHPQTAAAIAREIGISVDGGMAMAGGDLQAMGDDELAKRVPAVSVYARVTAEHKLRIINAWKANGAIVAMTGDGINDAPAIKGADIGIAMGRSGSEYTKQASDMIITDDNFSTIVTAVEEGRGVYDNIRKTLLYLLSGNAGELLLVGLCAVIGLPTPLLAIHLLWVNLVTDGFPAIFLAADRIDPDVMGRKPRRSSERIADAGFLRSMLITGLLTAGVAFIVFIYVLETESLEQARTYAFTVIVFAELFRSFGARSESRPVWRLRVLDNIGLLIVVAVSFVLQCVILSSEAMGSFLKTMPVPLSDALILVALGAIPLVVMEILKVIAGRTSVAKI